MPHETEAKYKVDTFAAVRRALRALGAEYRWTAVQTDNYFDTPGRTLLKAGSGLRLRRVRYVRRARGRGDDRAEITFKGPVQGGRRAKVRKEVQTRLDCPEVIEEIVSCCGLAPVLVIQKRRTTYRLGRCTVELDELPMLGRFVEVEGPDERAVHRAAAKLRLAGEPIADHYVNLLVGRCPRVGQPCLEVTFDRCTPKCPHW